MSEGVYDAVWQDREWRYPGAQLLPADRPVHIQVDKEGAQRHNYAGQRGYHPLLAVAAGTGDVLMPRLRQGRANTARGAAHFLRETVSRVRHAGATGELTVRADSGFYTHDIVAVCRKLGIRFSSLAGRLTRTARRLTRHLPPGLALGKPVQQRPGETARPPTPFLTASDPSTELLNRLADLRQVGPRVSPAARWLPISPAAGVAARK